MVGYDCWSEAEKNGIIWIFRVQDVGHMNKTQEHIEEHVITASVSAGSYYCTL